MNTQILIDTARKLVADEKGLLAMDESNLMGNKRFAKLGIPEKEEARRAYREPNIILPGLTCPKQETVDEAANATVKCLFRAVPATVPGIAFLSGSQSAELASARLNAMNLRFQSQLPWAFSFARAIQQPALEIWRGGEVNVSAAQKALLHRAECNRAARRGEYSAVMEKL